jgi:hypothetical protein
MYLQVVLSLGLLAECATIGGLLRHRRYRACPTFLLYLLVVLVTELLPTLWPERFFTGSFWLVRESMHNVARFAVAMELAYRTFRAFPGARSTARGLLLLFVVTSLVSVVATAWELPTLPEYSEILTRLQPPLLTGTIWLLVGIAALILWYRLPVESMHKAILLGWVPYLLVFSAGLDLARRYGWEQFLPWLNYVHTTAYLLLLGYWAWAAWAPTTARVLAVASVGVAARSAA